MRSCQHLADRKTSYIRMVRRISIGLLAVACAPAFGQALPNKAGLTLDEQSVWLLNSTRVQRQLRLQSGEQQKVTQAFGVYTSAENNLFKRAAGPTAEQLANLDHMLAASVLKSLEPAHRSRLHQLALQVKGPFALTEEPFASEVGLKPAQRQAIHKIVASYDQMQEDYNSGATRVFVQHPNAGSSERANLLSSLQPQQLALARAKRADEQKILNVLTAQQKAKWANMLGPHMP